MTHRPKHIGLTFTDEHIDLVQSKADAPHIDSAKQFLLDHHSDDPLVQAQLAGLRYRFLNDADSAQQAVKALQTLDWMRDPQPYQDALKITLAWLSVVEMVRDNPAWERIQTDWFTTFDAYLGRLNQPPDDATLLDSFWLSAVNIGAGIVLDDEALLEHGAETYRQAVDEHIHPEGYLKGIVDEDEATDTYLKQVSGTCALVLMAEMAEQVGMDLWGYNNRGVTPITAATYLHYYYYYPEKWKWEADLTPEQTEAIIKAQGAFIEIVNRRSPMRGIETLLEDQRPLFDPYGGGLTTLTHGTSAPESGKKRWRLFG